MDKNVIRRGEIVSDSGKLYSVIGVLGTVMYMLDYAVAFHKGTGTVNYFWDMMAELVKPEDLQILKERAEAIVEGGADK